MCKINYEAIGLRSSECNGEVYVEERVCVNCGNPAYLVQGYTPWDVRLEQFYCESCHIAFVTKGNGEFVRFGTLNFPDEFGGSDYL